MRGFIFTVKSIHTVREEFLTVSPRKEQKGPLESPLGPCTWPRRTHASFRSFGEGFSCIALTEARTRAAVSRCRQFRSPYHGIAQQNSLHHVASN